MFFRKNENQSNEAGLLGESVQDPHVIVHGSTDSEILDDGFRWRKYGQKHVKGNPYPRLNLNDLFLLSILYASTLSSPVEYKRGCSVSFSN